MERNWVARFTIMMASCKELQDSRKKRKESGRREWRHSAHEQTARIRLWTAPLRRGEWWLQCALAGSLRAREAGCIIEEDCFDLREVQAKQRNDWPIKRLKRSGPIWRSLKVPQSPNAQGSRNSILADSPKRHNPWKPNMLSLRSCREVCMTAPVAAATRERSSWGGKQGYFVWANIQQRNFWYNNSHVRIQDKSIKDASSAAQRTSGTRPAQKISRSAKYCVAKSPARNQKVKTLLHVIKGNNFNFGLKE